MESQTYLSAIRRAVPQSSETWNEAEYAKIRDAMRNAIRPAAGEVPVTVRGRSYLYCYDPEFQKHVYLDLGNDMILSDEEAEAIFGGAH